MTPWDHAVGLWRRPGVEAACLALQDDDGQCVPLLLWRLWALAERRAVPPDTLRAAVAAARDWNDAVVSPLRRLRRDLTAPRPPIGDAARLALRERLTAAELAAEQALLAALEALTPAEPAAGRPPPPLPALLELAAVWGGPPPREGLARLARAL